MNTSPTPEEPDIDWGSLETEVTPDGQFRPRMKTGSTVNAKNVKFPCSQCGGSGQWRGRGKCFTCNGKGYFLTSEADRKRARQTRATSKARKLRETREAFDQQYPDVAPFLASASWSPFCTDLLAKLNQYGALTDSQVAAVRRTAAKSAERRTQWDAEKRAGNTTVDLSPIRRMFETAVGNGYQYPVYRAAGLEITRAPDHGRNPGALYVKEGDNYLGKIIGIEYTGRPAPALQAIAADPRGEAIRYGQRTGRCSCCGRTLYAEGSINAGIGPICAQKWGL